MVGLGASVGVVGRYAVGEWSKQHIGGFYPAGTFIVNMLGCLVIGAAQYLFLHLGKLSRSRQLLIVVGFCGGFTTFSTFSVETLRLIEGGNPLAALGYQVFSLLLGLLAVTCGIGIAALSVRIRNNVRRSA